MIYFIYISFIDATGIKIPVEVVGCKVEKVEFLLVIIEIVISDNISDN